MLKCSQDGCQQEASYEYAWPGKPTEHACTGHAIQILYGAKLEGVTINIKLIGPMAQGFKRLSTPAKPEIET